jgi:type IV pilus assembly protein PilF
LTKKRISSSIVAVLALALSACVTQEFSNDETPVVKNQANRDDMAATRISLGLGYLKMGNMAQAKQNLEKAKQFSPNMVQVYTAFAHYYETVGESELTIASFEKALALKSDDADTLNNYGVYLCRQGETEAAEKQFLKAISVPSYLLVAKSYENLSSCFLQKNDFVKAEVYLHKAIMHSPGNSGTIFQMVRLQYAMGEFAQAKVFEQRFEKVTRRITPQSLALAYKVYWKLDQRRIAKNYGTMLVKMYPQSWESQQYLLNELELIEADNLAKRYQSTLISETPTKSKKRVVKLSPRQATPKQTRSSKLVNSAEIAEARVDLKVKSAAKPSTKSTAVIPANAVANPAAIIAALTMENTKVSDNTSQQPPTSSEQLVTPHTAEPEKRKVVLVVPKAEGNEIKKAVTAEDETISEVDNVLKTNQERSTPSTTQAPITKTPKKAVATKSTANSKFHVVKAGDTLYGISMKYNIKIRALRRWNNLSSGKKIRIKDKLYLIDPKTVTE